MNPWGLYPWFRELGSEHIHPHDLGIAETHSPYCFACEVVGQEGEYLVLVYGENRIRCKPALFRPISTPPFRLGQTVKTKLPRTARTGVVREIGWHYGRNQPSFFLTIEGKKIKSRYWADELETAEGKRQISVSGFEA